MLIKANFGVRVNSKPREVLKLKTRYLASFLPQTKGKLNKKQ